MEYTIEEIKKAFFMLDFKPTSVEWDIFKNNLKIVTYNNEAWKKDFNLYIQLVNEAKITILTSPHITHNRILKYWPNLDIRKSLELSIERFWGKEEGWKNKKKCKAKKIDMVETLIKNIDKNKIFIDSFNNSNKSFQQLPNKPYHTPEVEI